MSTFSLSTKKRVREEDYRPYAKIQMPRKLQTGGSSSSQKDDLNDCNSRFGLTRDELWAAAATPPADLRNASVIAFLSAEIDNCLIWHEFFELSVLLFSILNNNFTGIMRELHNAGIISRIAGIATGAPLKELFPNDEGVDLCVRVSRLLVVAWKTRMKQAASTSHSPLSKRGCQGGTLLQLLGVKTSVW